ncbi:MAG: hypothetical protein DHS20C11_27140 [Lysobacteraceae bacterium]|nr:MAG: hypothetical protein DHS20C11_27140 [Xanthomonadaceae bacterium]
MLNKIMLVAVATSIFFPAANAITEQELVERAAQLQNTKSSRSLLGIISTVGTTGPGSCDFTTIQAAIDGGANLVRVVQGTYVENLSVVDRDIDIQGGYASCADAESGNLPMDPDAASTVVDPGSLTALNVSGSGSSNLVSIVNMQFSGGSGFFAPGGIGISGDNDVSLDNVNIVDNFGTLGGGVLVTGGSAALLVENSFINNNQSNTDGGGLACTDSGIIIVGAYVQISGNHADENGGGISADNCAVLSFAGDDIVFGRVPMLTGILGNTANQHGGGIYAEQGAGIFLSGAECFGLFCNGNPFAPARLSANQADADMNATLGGDDGDGGGLYATGAGTTVSLGNTWIDQNSAGRDGGGIYVTSGVELLMGAIQGSPCAFSGCSRIFGNTAGATVSSGTWGGGITVIASAVNVLQTLIEANTSNGPGTGVYVSSPTTAVFEGNMFFNQIPITRTPAGTSTSYTFFLNSSEATLAYNTFARNNAPLAVIGLGSMATLNFLGSVVDDESVDAFSLNGGTLVTDCSAAHETTSAGNPAGLSTLIGDPFVDAIGYDFHIVPGSELEDACDASVFPDPEPDLDGDSRGFDNPDFPDLEGPYDIGADETLTSDIIFADGLGDP